MKFLVVPYPGSILAWARGADAFVATPVVNNYCRIDLDPASSVDFVEEKPTFVARDIVARAVFVALLFAPLPVMAGGSIAVVLDVSGSMNAWLPEGKTRIEAAKLAVEDLVGKLPIDLPIALGLWPPVLDPET